MKVKIIKDILSNAKIKVILLTTKSNDMILSYMYHHHGYKLYLG